METKTVQQKNQSYRKNKIGSEKSDQNTEKDCKNTQELSNKEKRKIIFFRY